MEGVKRLASHARHTLAEVLQITVSSLTYVQVRYLWQIVWGCALSLALLPILWTSASKNVVVAKQTLNSSGSSDSLSVTEEAF